MSALYPLFVGALFACALAVVAYIFGWAAVEIRAHFFGDAA